MDVLRRLGALLCDGDVAEAVRKVTGYFQTNQNRMRYGRFRQLGLFVGSGVVEAGCKTVIHQRLKQSGMHWTPARRRVDHLVACSDASAARR